MRRGGLKGLFVVAMSAMAVCFFDGGAAAAGEADTLRTRIDAVRGRSWVLGLDAVRVHDVRDGRIIRKIELPGWSVARTVCAPDLLLDRPGAAYLSSNVQPEVWRIDGATFAVMEIRIILDGRERWDVGFGALAFGANGSLLALTSAAGSLWSLDLGGGIARRVDPGSPFTKACEIDAKYLKKSQRSEQ